MHRHRNQEGVKISSRLDDKRMTMFHDAYRLERRNHSDRGTKLRRRVKDNKKKEREVIVKTKRRFKINNKSSWNTVYNYKAINLKLKNFK